MYNYETRYLKSNSGGTTIEWVVITAAILALGLTVVLSIATSENEVATKMDAIMDTVAPVSNSPLTIRFIPAE